LKVAKIFIGKIVVSNHYGGSKITSKGGKPSDHRLNHPKNVTNVVHK